MKLELRFTIHLEPEGLNTGKILMPHELHEAAEFLMLYPSALQDGSTLGLDSGVRVEICEVTVTRHSPISGDPMFD